MSRHERGIKGQHWWWTDVQERLDGRTWTWLCAFLGYTENQLANARKREPRLGEIANVARAFGIHPGELFE